MLIDHLEHIFLLFARKREYIEKEILNMYALKKDTGDTDFNLLVEKS